MFKQLSAITVASLLSATAAFAQADGQTSPSPSNTPAVTDPAPSTTSPSTTDATTPSTTTSPTTMDSAANTGAPMMTDAEAKNWINKTVYSSDGKNLGEVSAIDRDASGHVRELHADIGGFLGLGETRVKVLPSQFKLSSDRVILNVTGDQANTLPKIEN
jgi:hypothetical protein